MADYTHEFSNFPNEILTRHNFKDVDDSIASIVNQIKTLQANGEYDRAAEYIDMNKDTLGPYVLGSEYLNTIYEETRNVEIYTKAKKQQIHYQEHGHHNTTGNVDHVNGDIHTQQQRRQEQRPTEIQTEGAGHATLCTNFLTHSILPFYAIFD